MHWLIYEPPTEGRYLKLNLHTEGAPTGVVIIFYVNERRTDTDAHGPDTLSGSLGAYLAKLKMHHAMSELQALIDTEMHEHTPPDTGHTVIGCVTADDDESRMLFAQLTEQADIAQDRAWIHAILRTVATPSNIDLKTVIDHSQRGKALLASQPRLPELAVQCRALLVEQTDIVKRLKT